LLPWFLQARAGFTYEEAWRDMMRVNVFALHVLLEHARLRAADMTIVYAGSSKVFPTPLAGLIDETTEMRASCLYSVGELAARERQLPHLEQGG
jgi:nucleoside-diphosphate-sugar epimerase